MPPKIDSIKLGVDRKKIVKYDQINFGVLHSENISRLNHQKTLLQPARFNYKSNSASSFVSDANDQYSVRPDQAVRFDATWGGVIQNGPNDKGKTPISNDADFRDANF